MKRKLHGWFMLLSRAMLCVVDRSRRVHERDRRRRRPPLGLSGNLALTVISVCGDTPLHARWLYRHERESAFRWASSCPSPSLARPYAFDNWKSAQVTVPAALLTTAKTASVTVVNPGVPASNALTLQITP